MYGFIYLTTNKITGKKYIGMCKYTHEKHYLGSGRLLKKDIKKYGKENFEREILEICDNFNELSESEYKWIEKYNAVHSDEFYNIAYGGFGGCSESTKEYWNMFTKEERKKMRNWGRKTSVTGANNPMFGRKHSEETKRIIGMKSVNRNWGRKTSVTGANNPRARKIIVCYDDGKIEKYDCIKEFCNNKSINYSTAKGLLKRGVYSKKYKVSITYA